MSDKTDPEMCSLVNNLCKPPKNFHFLETDQSFKVSMSLYRFVIVDERIEPIACLVFYLVIKMWKKLYKKSYQE